MRNEAVVIYGDGKQVRDVLHVGDAVAAYRSVLKDINKLSGQAFNLGGGARNAVSLLIVLEEITAILGREVAVTYAERRTGDQLYFVADTNKLLDQVGWRPGIGWRDGLRDLAEWLSADLGLASPRPRRTKRRAQA
jgi:CDP-paratose 2-epimerase